MAGFSLINNLSANTAQLYFSRDQGALANTVDGLSSGLRIRTAADDPSGLAIAEGLQAQVNGYDAAVGNIQNAHNAIAVTDGALATTTGILQRLRSLAVQAASDLTNASDRKNLQVEAAQLILEVNRVSQNSTFNGVQLLDGSHAGFVAARPASLTITSNTAVSGAGVGVGTTGSGISFNAGVLAAFAAPTGGAGTVDGTIELKVVNTGVSIAVQETFYDSATGLASVSSILFAPQQGVTNGSPSSAFDNVQIGFGAFATADVGATAFIKVSGPTAAQSNASQPALGFQSGSVEGQSIGVGIEATNARTLGISNIDLIGNGNDPTIAAQDAIGQIDLALERVLTQRAKLGSLSVRLSYDEQNAREAANALQISESSRRDLDIAKAATAYNRQTAQLQIAAQVLAQANLQPDVITRLFR